MEHDGLLVRVRAANRYRVRYAILRILDSTLVECVMLLGITCYVILGFVELLFDYGLICLPVHESGLAAESFTLSSAPSSLSRRVGVVSSSQLPYPWWDSLHKARISADLAQKPAYGETLSPFYVPVQTFGTLFQTSVDPRRYLSQPASLSLPPPYMFTAEPRPMVASASLIGETVTRRKRNLRRNAKDLGILAPTSTRTEPSQLCLAKTTDKYQSILNNVSILGLVLSIMMFCETVTRMIVVTPTYFFKHVGLRFDVLFTSLSLLGEIILFFWLRPQQVAAWEQDEELSRKYRIMLVALISLRIILVYRCIRKIHGEIVPGSEVARTIEVCDQMRKDMPGAQIKGVHVFKNSAANHTLFEKNRQLMTERMEDPNSKVLFVSANGVSLESLQKEGFELRSLCQPEPLGVALYGAERACYSDCNTFFPRGSEAGSHERQMLVIEVLLGNVEDMGQEESPQLQAPHAGFDTVQGGPWLPEDYHPEVFGLEFRDVASIVYGIHNPKGQALITALVTYENPDASEEIDMLDQEGAKDWHDYCLHNTICEGDAQQVQAKNALRSAIEARSIVDFEEATKRCHQAQVDQQSIQKLKSKCRETSEHLGISLRYLLSAEFREYAQSATGKTDPTFKEMSTPFFTDPNSQRVGESMLCPRDLQAGCSYVDAVQPADRKDANYFLSWVWSYQLGMFTSALERWASNSEEAQTNAFLFVCFFCNNQWRILVDNQTNSSEDLEALFDARLRRIGRVVALVDTWDTPTYTTRIWTIFEQYEAIRLHIPVNFILPEGPSESLIQQLKTGESGILRVIRAVSNVNAEEAKATMPEDERRVKARIQRDVGFANVNNAVRNSMTEWAASEFKRMIDEMREVQKPQESLTGRVRETIREHVDDWL